MTRRSPFKASYDATMRKLRQELSCLGASAVVCEADCDESQIRNDGQLRGDARLRSPGIILNFQSKHGPLRFACDTYDSINGNYRAIALTLEALRACERYGVVKRGEQFVGWKQLPSSAPAAPIFASKEAAADFIAEGTSYKPILVLQDAAIRKAAYRQRCNHLHPDKPGGSHDGFVKLQAAMAKIEESPA